MPLGDGSEIVLLVEDDEAVRELSTSMLRELNYAVIAVEDGHTALQILEVVPNVCVLFTDVGLPGGWMADSLPMRRDACGQTCAFSSPPDMRGTPSCITDGSTPGSRSSASHSPLPHSPLKSGSCSTKGSRWPTQDLFWGTSAGCRRHSTPCAGLGVSRPSRRRAATGRCAVKRLLLAVPAESEIIQAGSRSRPEAFCAGAAGRYDSSMLQALRPEDALAIAEISRRRSRDEQAMAQYLGIGRGKRATGPPPEATLLRLPGEVDLAAFESEERRRLEAAIAQLSPDARRELIALVWLVQRPLSSFEAALRRTRRIPPAAQPGYLMGIRLERYIAEGLRKLGCGAA